jgi:predicted  nucleic acid-binding Zn-ribbon protein
MDDLKQDLDLLYELQTYDVEIANIRNQISQSPALIEEKNKELKIKKTETDAKKKSFVELNFIKKEKESLLDSKEKTISKYSMELNAVKSNDIYKTLLLEIEKAKDDKNIIEDELLELMNKIDNESVIVKKSAAELKEFEQKIATDVSKIETFKKKLEDEIDGLEQAREEHKLKVNQSILSQYERLREGRDGEGIAIVNGESCGACGMMLRPQLINQAQKGRELVFCDNCSRILLKK